MKSASDAKQWIDRLRSALASGGVATPDAGPGRMAAMRDAMGLLKQGNLAAATAAIQGTLGGGAREKDITPRRRPAAESHRVLKGTFSDYERPVTAPGRPDADARFQEASFTNAAGSRRYKLFIPSAYCGQPMPLVVMLHGCKQSADDFALGTGMNALAEKEQCFVVYPQQSKTANGSDCWNWFNSQDQRRGCGEPAIIAGLTRELVTKYGLDAHRVYVAGLSAGGAMAVVMGRTYPDLYAAVGVHSGLPYGAAHDVPSAFAAMKGSGPAGAGAHGPRLQAMPTIVVHGDRDKTVHPCNGERVISQSAPSSRQTLTGLTVAAPLSIEEEKGGEPHGHAYTRRLYRNGSGEVVVEQWIVHGGGHAWFGGNARGSYTDPKGPDASQAMLRFFVAHARNPQTDSPAN